MINSFKILLLCFSAFLLFESCSTNAESTGTRAASTKTPDDSIRFNLEYTKTFPKSEVTATYCRAIEEYINAVYKGNKPLPDTLFIGTKGDGFEFPDIELPAAINKVNVRLMTLEEANKNFAQKKSMVHLNVIGWREKNNSEFIIVTFFEGGKPQHNCHLYFTHIPERNEIKLDSLNFEYPYPNVKHEK